MYIKSMVIDGFKSYAQRTEITGFDPMFNAITGLNGSGKSNILDSICFLLGISNLSQVRASNLQELVYKNGQAGVTKATVSIVFDNSDKEQSPLGYEQYDEITVTRQVVIGGRNKYLINGSNANNTRVQDLFRSVQLNVNNPHFLIMQGRITKVLNMKPPEILSMIEEAAGTKLYESKRESAQRTIEKKDAKLQEIEKVLTEEINPTLARLKDERSSYLEYQKVIRELEHLNKLYIAYQFVCAEESKHKSAEDLKTMQESVTRLTQRQKEIDVNLKELTVAIRELEERRDQEAGGVLAKLENELVDVQKEDTKAQSALTHKRDALTAEQKKLRELGKNCTNDKSSIDGKRKELDKLAKELEKLLEKSTNDVKAHSDAQAHYHAVSAGLSSNADGEDASLNDQLMGAKQDISNADTETKQAEMRLKHSRAEVKKKQTELKNSEKGYNKDKAVYDAAKSEIDSLMKEVGKLGYEDGQQERLQAERRQLANQAQHLQQTVDTLEARFPQLQFQYKDPEKNFDRSKVHGLVAKLVKVKDARTATALEVAAGGKLYNVVVDTESTGKKLLQRGELKRRYTIIPLNKISARAIDPHVVKKAENLVGRDNVHTALSLVGYEDDLVRAMEFVFGNAFVCSDMESAKKVTFNEQVMRKSVTLEGDSFDPSGTLTGGARNNVGNMLAKLGELRDAEEQLAVVRQQLMQLDRQLADITRVAARYGEIKQKLELKQTEADMLEGKLKQSTHGQELENLQALEASIEDSEKILNEAKEKKAKATQKVKTLEDKLKNAKAVRERELKEAEQKVTQVKKAVDESNKKTKEKEQEVESAKLEAEELEREVRGYEEQITATEEAIKGLEDQAQELQKSAAASKETVKKAQEKLNAQKERLKACNKDIEVRVREQRDLQKEGNAADMEVQELEHKIAKTNKDTKDAVKTVEHYLKTYEWISTERKYFGQANTAYDFEANDPREAGKRIQKLQDTKDSLSKKVNMRAMNMLGKAEEQYLGLMKKREIVLADKAKIAAVIKELDEKKNEALKKAHTQVNQDFGSIFSTLLPGTQAKLVAPDGCSILDGLEVKVAFGTVWKQSLQELSGGQRSLVALSLILSLLLFKPAPLYILDEVDAALDLSHTQNIGQMLRTHFRHSQFIVVSLKDGMFNNANVLFKTKFVDGVSTVTRYAQASANRPPAVKTASTSSAGAKAKKPRLNVDDMENQLVS